MNTSRSIRTATAGVAIAALTIGVASAQTYPSQGIELIVPAPAGGGTDASARMLSTLLEADLGHTVVVRNVAGGGGSVGVTEFVLSDPDGYTLLATWNSPITTVPHVQPVQYDIDSYVPIASTSETAYTLCVAPDFPADTGAEFLQELAANPDRYTYGNDGVGGTMQLAAERIFGAFDASALAIPFGGAGETLQNFLGGHVDIYGGSIAPIAPYVEDGQAKCLIVTSAEPVAALPNAAGLAELGRPDLETVLWRAVLGPAGMPEDRVAVIADAIARAMDDPGYIEFLAGRGETPRVVTGDALRQRIVDEHDALGTVLGDLGLGGN